MEKLVIFGTLLALAFSPLIGAQAATGMSMDVRVISMSPTSFVIDSIDGKIKIERPAHHEESLKYALKYNRMIRYFVMSESRFVEKYPPYKVKSKKIEGVKF